jgi:hypothetical protein
MKTSILFAGVLAGLLLAGCKKDSSAPTTPPFAASIDGTQLRLTGVKAKVVGTANGTYDLLQITAIVDGDSAKTLGLQIAYKDVVKGQVIDIASDDGHAYIFYISGVGHIYAAGYGTKSVDGKVTITQNDHAKGKIAGTFSGVLKGISDATQQVTCTEGQFSANY